MKLDIFGEIVVTLGTVPQGQGHETTASQVVADILGVTPDDVTVRAGHDTYWNSHAGFSGTYASQFAVTGLGAVKGATDKLAHEIKRVAAGVFGATPDDIELAEGQARLKANAEAAIPFMGIGAIVNANNAILPEDVRDVTLNCRYVYVPPFQLPDKERKFGNLTLTYASQVHVCLVEIDPETGVYEIVDYAAVDDCGTRIHPQIVEGQVHGATAQALGAATHEIFAYDEEGNLLTPNFYDYHVPHALDMPPLKTGYLESASPFTPLGAKGMGEGGGAGIHAVCAALQDALASRGKPTVWRSCNPYHQVWEYLREPKRLVEVDDAVKVEGTRSFAAPRETVWEVLNSPERMAKLMPGVESFDVQDDRALAREREDPARPGRPAHELRLHEARGARSPSSRSCTRRATASARSSAWTPRSTSPRTAAART